MSKINQLKKYSFIKPILSEITIEELYDFTLHESDLYDKSEYKKEEFLKFTIHQVISYVLTYYMVKHKTTLADFTLDSDYNLELMIVDNSIEYKKRRYNFKAFDRLKEGDDIIFYKKIDNDQFYVICVEAKKGKDN